MRGRKKIPSEQASPPNAPPTAPAADRTLEGELSDARATVGLWRGRAERLRGENYRLTTENERLYRDNQHLSAKLVEIATTPLPSPPMPSLDITAILDQFRRTVQPDVHIHARDDLSSEQRAGINWSHQGLDNTGGTPELGNDPFDREPLSIPDYVLDIESLNPDDLKGTRG